MAFEHDLAVFESGQHAFERSGIVSLCLYLRHQSTLAFNHDAAIIDMALDESAALSRVGHAPTLPRMKTLFEPCGRVATVAAHPIETRRA